MEKPHRVFSMAFASVYPLYLQKVQKKGRTQHDLDTVVCWLTGYSAEGLQRAIDERVDIRALRARIVLTIQTLGEAPSV